MKQTIRIVLDIAKHVFQAHGAHSAGHVLFRKRLTRVKLLAFFAMQAPCLVATEACAHPDLAGLYFRAARVDPHRLCVLGVWQYSSTI